MQSESHDGDSDYTHHTHHCQCCSTGKCKRCSCARAGQTCVDCYHLRYGTCSNSQTAQVSRTGGPADTSHDLPNSDDLPSLSDIFDSARTRNPTLRHVPRGARNIWASALTSCMNAVLSDPGSIRPCWSKLFLLPRFTLGTTQSAAGSTSRRQDQNEVKNRIQRWSNNAAVKLWSEAISSPSPQTHFFRSS